jgi:hypothetical protein
VSPVRTQRIAILLYDDYEPIDVWGFTEAFSIARFLGSDFAKPPFPFNTFFVAADKQPVRASNGPRAMPDYDLTEALSEPFDVLMVPGGIGTRTPRARGATCHPEAKRSVVEGSPATDDEHGAYGGDPSTALGMTRWRARARGPTCHPERSATNDEHGAIRRRSLDSARDDRRGAESAWTHVSS